MGGDDFNKTDDSERNSNYEIDISTIIEQAIKEHDKKTTARPSKFRRFEEPLG